MCIGTPVRIVRHTGLQAVCEDRHGRQMSIDLLLVGPQPPGTWVMSFKGSARELIDADSAALVGDALDALQALASGDAGKVETAFADLIAREPVLPEHLRTTTSSGRA